MIDNFVGAFFFLIIIDLKYIHMELTPFQHCLRIQPNPGIVRCVGQQAISTLQGIQDLQNYTIDNGFTMTRNDNINSRSLPSFLDQDPMDFRGILENAGAIVGQRTLQWDLGLVQQGLCLRIGPTAESASMLEFIIDPNHDRGDRYIQEETPSTARILAKQFIVPFLLGLKFNLITILPLFFAGIILLCKKAAFLGKLALFVTGLFGYGSVFSLGSLASGWGLGGSGGIGGGYPGHHHIHHSPSVLTDVGVGLGGTNGPDYLSGGYYKAIDERKPVDNVLVPQLIAQKDVLEDQFYNYEKKVLLQDRNAKLYEKELENEDQRGFRNFAWKTN